MCYFDLTHMMNGSFFTAVHDVLIPQFANCELVLRQLVTINTQCRVLPIYYNNSTIVIICSFCLDRPRPEVHSLRTTDIATEPARVSLYAKITEGSGGNNTVERTSGLVLISVSRKYGLEQFPNRTLPVQILCSSPRTVHAVVFIERQPIDVSSADPDTVGNTDLLRLRFFQLPASL